jgi:6-phosphogluconolactonase
MQPRHAIVLGLSLGLAVLQVHAAEKTSSGKSVTHDNILVYIGTQGGGGPPGQQPSSDAAPQGIYAARLDEKTGHLTSLGIQIQLQRSDWLINSPKRPVIYSVANGDGGMAADSVIYSLGVDGKTGALKVINKVDAGGKDATHLAIDAASGTLFSANHGSGTVAAIPLLADGSVGEVASLGKDYGVGPNRRQNMPQAHGVTVDPTHKYVLVTDFGADRIFIYHFDGKTRTLTASTPPFDVMPPGSGPRHPVFHPSGKFLLVDSEMGAELRSYSWDPKKGLVHLVQKLSPYPAGFSGEKSAAELAVSRDGRFVYLSLRGDQNSLIVYAFNQKTGMLTERQRMASGGKMPWSFGIDPTGHWMVVTNQASDSVNVFKINPATGKLTATNESLSIPKPVTVVFYPH